MKSTIKLKLNADVAGRKAGDIVTVAARGDTPVDPFWQRRLRDAARDHCVERIEPPARRSRKSPPSAKAPTDPIKKASIPKGDDA